MENKTFIGIDEAAAYLGVKKTSLYNKCFRRQIPHYKPSGGKIYFRVAELDEWIAAGRVSTDTEIQDKANNYSKQSIKQTN